ncbi:MAG: uracil-DNA glycosylase [Candidatus Nanoarchaeia archaeon]
MSKKSDLLDLQNNLLATLTCPLRDAATNLVFGEGNPDADILFIGEAPGAKEDAQGEPFVGRSGQLLNNALKTITLKRKDIYIANILKYRPPKNRNPTREEIRKHTPYLVKQIHIIKPKIIVPLGNYATKFVLAGFDPSEMKNVSAISSLHGMSKNIAIGGVTYTVFPMFHPSATIYNRRLLPEFFNDFKKLADLLE